MIAMLQAAFCLLMSSAPPGVAVGVEEKLGATVPLHLVLRDEENRPVVLAGLIQKPTLLTLNYFRCAGICSPQLNGMADVLSRTTMEPGRDFQVLTVSFDPRDTPSIAAKKRENYLNQVPRSLPAGTWRFLTGDAAATKALADSVGFGFQAQGDDFVHPAVLMVLGPKGQVTRYLHGLTFVPAEIEMAVRDAAQGQVRPTIAKVLNVCFRYDPVARRQVFSFTRCCATLGILLAMGFVVSLVLGRRKKP